MILPLQLASPRNLGFTLIELLIVIAIIAILAAVAVPNFLEAQTRAKVSRVRSDLRSAAVAIEAYATDENQYPPQYAVGTNSSAVEQANLSLPRLTTPIAYLSSIEILRDAFAQNIVVQDDESIPGGSASERPYLQYANFSTFSEDYVLSQDFNGWLTWSIGPDKNQDALNFRLYNFAINQENTLQEANLSQSVYDPTNGTLSNGDVGRSGGEIPATGRINNS